MTHLEEPRLNQGSMRRCGTSRTRDGRELEPPPPELPPPDTRRWTLRRKAAVVKAALSGVINLEEVCRRYGLSVEEFRSWHNAMESHGMRGLYTTKLQKYRYFPARSRNGTGIATSVSATPR